MRPTEKDCQRCGTTFAVAKKGKIPQFCPGCRGNVGGRGDSLAEPVQPAGVASPTGATVVDPLLDEAVASVLLDKGDGGTQSFVSDEPIDLDDDFDLPGVPVRSVVWTGENFVEVREALDDGVCIDVHRADGRPFAEVYGVDRDWFTTVRPGDTVWHDGVVVAR